MPEQMTVWVPTEDASGECYHARVCGAHLLTRVQAAKPKIVTLINEMDLSACGSCVKNHGLPDRDTLFVEVFGHV